jgi:hypothetical protein
LSWAVTRILSHRTTERPGFRLAFPFSVSLQLIC